MPARNTRSMISLLANFVCENLNLVFDAYTVEAQSVLDDDTCTGRVVRGEQPGLEEPNDELRADVGSAGFGESLDQRLVAELGGPQVIEDLPERRVGRILGHRNTLVIGENLLLLQMKGQ